MYRFVQLWLFRITTTELFKDWFRLMQPRRTTQHKTHTEYRITPKWVYFFFTSHRHKNLEWLADSIGKIMKDLLNYSAYSFVRSLLYRYFHLHPLLFILRRRTRFFCFARYLKTNMNGVSLGFMWINVAFLLYEWSWFISHDSKKASQLESWMANVEWVRYFV